MIKLQVIIEEYLTIYVGAVKKRFCIKNINDINYTVTFSNTNKKTFYRKNQLIKQIINEFHMEYIHIFLHLSEWSIIMNDLVYKDKEIKIFHVQSELKNYNHKGVPYSNDEGLRLLSA